jgi:lambda family phage minor tail protein L
MMSAHLSEIQKLDPSAILELFTLDCTVVGGGIMRFVKSSDSNQSVIYQTLVYTPVDVMFNGLETSGQGALPTPTLSIANSDGAQGGVIQAVVNSLGDLNGCRLTRIRVNARFLDNRPDADPAAFFGPDIYAIEQKTSDTPTEIVWELSASIDQAGRSIPGRPAVRNNCLSRYRVWDAALNRFVYTRAICPYAGTNYFNELNQSVASPADDKPSRTVDCCKLRFGANKPLPFGGFPGMARVQ